MDSSVSSVLLAVVIGLFVLLSELGSKGKKKQGRAQEQHRPARGVRAAAPSQTYAADEAERHENLRRRREAPRPAPVVKKAETPVRSVAATKVSEKEIIRDIAPKQGKVTAATLRSAFVWSEILKTKF